MIFLIYSAITFYLLQVFARKRLLSLARRCGEKPASREAYYGFFLIFLSFIIFVFLVSLQNFLTRKFLNFSILHLGIFSVTFAMLVFIFFIKPSFKARLFYEKIVKFLLFFVASFSLFITALIIFTVIFKSWEFFSQINALDFFLGTNWDPQSSLRGDLEVFGLIPVISGTILIMIIAMLVAVPVGIFSAIFLSQFASSHLRNMMKPVIEMLAAIPTVVYGYFAAVYVGPFLRRAGEFSGIPTTSESALAAGIVMGIMIVPFIVSLVDDALNAVPQNLKNSALALGFTKFESIWYVILPAAFPSVIGAILLAVSRAIGETMIVTMAAGLNAKMTLNPFDSVTTATAQIVATICGDQEFDSVRSLSAFALALTVFTFTFILNVIAVLIVKRHKERNA